jgi:hypothetical protein
LWIFLAELEFLIRFADYIRAKKITQLVFVRPELAKNADPGNFTSLVI